MRLTALKFNLNEVTRHLLAGIVDDMLVVVKWKVLRVRNNGVVWWSLCELSGRHSDLAEIRPRGLVWSDSTNSLHRVRSWRSLEQARLCMKKGLRGPKRNFTEQQNSTRTLRRKVRMTVVCTPVCVTNHRENARNNQVSLGRKGIHSLGDRVGEVDSLKMNTRMSVQVKHES